MRIRPLPVTEDNLVLWVTRLDEEGKSASTVSTYLSAVRSLALEHGQRLAPFRVMAVLCRARRALARRRARANAPQRKRFPITTEVLARLRHIIRDGSMTSRAVWAALTVGVYKMLRLRQVVVNARFGQHSYPRCSSVSVHATYAEIVVPSDKTDVAGNGKTVYIDKAGGRSCPLQAFSEYWRASRAELPRPKRNDPVFRVDAGRPLSESSFKRIVRRALKEAGYDLSRYRGFSMRRGGATAAHNAGVDMATIKSIGGWKSDAVLRYIDPSRASSRAAARAMAC
jgi:hypothetical protein